MAYEISSSVANSTFTTQGVTSSVTNGFEQGGKFSPDGTKLAVGTYRHGGAGSTDYGIDIYTSASSGGWSRTESIDTGTSGPGAHMEWYSGDNIFAIVGNNIKNFVSASASGWSAGEVNVATGGDRYFEFNPSKTILATWKGTDQNWRSIYSGSGNWTSTSDQSAGSYGDLQSLAWISDDVIALGYPENSSYRGILLTYKTTNGGASYSMAEYLNGDSVQLPGMGAALYYHSANDALLVGTRAGAADTENAKNKLILIQSGSEGHLPASYTSHTVIDSGKRPIDGFQTAPQSGNGDRVLMITHDDGADDADLLAIESGSAGWKVTVIDDNIQGPSSEGNIDISSLGAVVSNDIGNGAGQATFLVRQMIASNPALASTANETIGSSGGTISAGGTQLAPTAKLTFPASALSGDKSISISTTEENDPKINGINETANLYTRSYSKLLRVTLPASTTLSKAVTVELLHDDDADTSKLVLLKREATDDPWYVVPASSYSVGSGKISFTTHRFSDYQAVEDQNMARTKINNTQLLKLTAANSILGGALDITGSTAIGEALSSNMAFVVQSGSETPKKILASEMATFFNSNVSVTSVSNDAAHKIVFVDAAGSGQSLQADNNSLTFNPSSNLLTVGGSVVVGDGSNIGPASVTDLIELQADGDIIIKDGAYDFDIASHDGTNGLLLGGVTVTADAADLNQIDGITAGTVAASKAVVVDSSKDASGFRNVSGTGTITAFTALSGSKLVVGSADMSEADLEQLDGITAGTVAASKAVVVDSDKDASGFRNVSGTGTITAFTALSGSKLVVGSADMSEADLEQLDGITAGTVAASKAVVVDSDKDASGFRNVTATGAITGGSFVIGSADISEAELETIDGVTAGTVAASKAVVVDASKDITGFRNVTIAGTGSIAGDLTITGNLQVDGDQVIINTTILEVEDKTILIASGSANDAAANGAGLIVESGEGNKTFTFNATGDRFVSTENFDIASGKVYKINNTEVLSATGLTIGDAALSEADLEQLDGITAGTVAASKAVVVDANKDALGFRNLSSSLNVSASAFYGDGSNLTGVGAEVATSAANTEFKLSFVTDAAADAASLLIDSTAHGTYNPSANRIGLAEVSSSADLVLRGGAADDVQIQPANTTGDVVLFAKGGTLGNSNGFIFSGSDDKGLMTLVGNGSNSQKLQLEGGGSVAAIKGDMGLDLTAGNGALNVTSTGASAILQRSGGAKVTVTDQTVQLNTPSGAGKTIEFHNNGFKAGEIEVYTDSGNAAKFHIKSAAPDGLALSASAGVISLTGSTGISLVSVADTAIAVASDSLYFKDADGLVKSDTVADVVTGIAGTVTATGLAASSGVLSLAIHSLDAETIATGDKLAFADSDNGLHHETIDDLFKIGPNLVAAAVADVSADSILIIDANDSSNAKKESIADLVGATAGDGLTATNGVLAVAAVEKTFYSASSNTGADGGMSANLLTASLDNSGDGNALANSLEVYLNGMLQTISSSVATGVTGVFDYKVDNASTPTEVHLVTAIDDDDVLIIKYLKK